MFVSDEKNEVVTECIKELTRYAEEQQSPLYVIHTVEDIQRLIQYMNYVLLDDQFKTNLSWLSVCVQNKSYLGSKMLVQHISDIMRYVLLAVFGGTWIDASSMFTSVMPRWENFGYTFVAPGMSNEEHVKEAFFLGSGFLPTQQNIYKYIPENWFLWCTSNCKMMERWAILALSQFRMIVENKETQMSVCLHNLGETQPKIWTVSEVYLWTFSVFANVLRNSTIEVIDEHNIMVNNERFHRLSFESTDNGVVRVTPWFIKFTNVGRTSYRKSGKPLSSFLKSLTFVQF